MGRFLFFSFFSLISLCVAAQELPVYNKPLNIAIVAPLFIESAFTDDGNIRDHLPRQMNAGLEFMHGAEIALGVINSEGRKINAHFIDSKSSRTTLQTLMQNGMLAGMDLIVGGVREPEFQDLALFARAQRIPFISAIYPNDGGVRNDSFLVIMNSTLQTNVEAIYSYVVQKHSMDQILLVRQPGDNRIDDMFKALNRRGDKNLLKINSIAVDSINAQQLAMLVDTLKPAAVICGSLNEAFAVSMADAVYPYRSKMSLIGMPNWDAIRSLYDKERFQDFAILFTTPHVEESENELTGFFNNEYFTQYRAKPGAMAVRGFESTYHFTNLLKQHGDSLLHYLNENEYAPFHAFNFLPVSLSGDATVDYFENKHVFIVQILNGKVSRKP